MDTPFAARQARCMIALGAWLLFSSSACQAGPLLVYEPGLPSITGINGTLAYDASTGDFQSQSTPLVFVLPDSSFAFIDNGSLSVDLTVDKNGDFVSNGMGLALTGSVTLDGQTFTGDAMNPLLFGPVTAFGEQQPAGPPPFVFNGFFTVQGGALTQTMGGVFGGFPVGSTGAFTLEAEDVTGGILGNFQQSFSSSSVKSTVETVTPEPGTRVLALIGASIVGCGAWLRGRRPGRARSHARMG